MNVDLLALVFYLCGGRIRGVTRLNKIVFLLQEEFGLNGYNFSASKYGPWSGELADSIDELEKKGLVKIEEFSDPIYSFMQENPAKILTASDSLMERGRRIFEDISARNKIIAAEMRRRIRSYNSVPITYLLAYVYMKFPSFALNSAIRERVESWGRMYKLKGEREAKKEEDQVDREGIWDPKVKVGYFRVYAEALSQQE
jgi:hypothetical protein